MITQAILSAFNGRLRSEPFEHPERPEIILPVSPALDLGAFLGKDADLSTASISSALFRHTGRYEVLRTKQTAAIYEFVWPKGASR